MTVYKPGTQEGSTGEGSGDPTVVASTVWAKREALSGGEAVAAQEVVSDATYEVWVRYRADVTEEMWGVFDDGLRLNFGAVLPVGRRQWLRILCAKDRP